MTYLEDSNKLKDEINELRSKKGYLYAGLPKFRALFGRDSVISAWQLLDYDPTIAFSTIQALSSLQGSRIERSTGEYPGKILHEFYDDEEAFLLRKQAIPWLTRGPSYFSVDSTPLFLILAEKILPIMPEPNLSKIYLSIINAIKFLLNNGIVNEFLGYEKTLVGAGIQSQSWRDGIGDMLEKLKSPVFTVGVQGYTYGALSGAIQIIKDFGPDTDRDLIENIVESASRIKSRLTDNFWLDETSFFAIATDGDGVAEKAVTSDPGHLLFSGILSAKQEKDVVDRLFDNDMITDFGIRTLSTKERCFDEKAYQRGSVWPQDNWIIAMGLKERGYGNLYRDLRERIIDAYEKMGMMPEYYSVTKKGDLVDIDKLRIRPCFPQAWSAGAMVSFLQGE